MIFRYGYENGAVSPRMFDGSGYPNNLSGEEIPFGARILRLTDEFAALISERPYRKAFDIDTAVDIIIEEIKNMDMRVFWNFSA